MPGMARTHQDESLVPAYTLPDPLVSNSGQPVATCEQWQSQRRPEILRLFQDHVYGHSPARPRMACRRIGADQPVTVGNGIRAIRRFVQVDITPGPNPLTINVMIYLPATPGPHPVFVNLNFNGNHSVDPDPAIPLCSAWMLQYDTTIGVENHRATERSRGSSASRYPLDLIVSRGFALATCCYTEIEPDHPQGWKDSLRGRLLQLSGKQQFGQHDWGALGAWAWGLQSMLDYLETDSDIDARRSAVIGHSRLGKAALWAGAQDPRFSIVISNDSGEGGAALSKRGFGENVDAITTTFPHWFCPQFRTYANNEQALPVDQHELIALMAPRPVYIASATQDLWADPKGEFLSGVHAEPVYRLFGRKGLGTTQPPPPDTPIGDTIAYHNRTGKHDLTRYDWEQYTTFCARHWK